MDPRLMIEEVIREIQSEPEAEKRQEERGRGEDDEREQSRSCHEPRTR